jgi:D-sedoheptulose 7-phosphate isomerase
MKQIQDHIEVVSNLPLEQIKALAQRMRQALDAGGKIVLFGNGGSAADAQHIAAELVGRFRKERNPLAAIALTTDTSILTAVANDYGYEEVFARQVQALVTDKDVVIGISTSGKSHSVLKGLREANDIGAHPVMLTGGNYQNDRTFFGEAGMAGGYWPIGSKYPVCCEFLCVPSTDTPRIQEAHILIGHLLCELIDG